MVSAMETSFHHGVTSGLYRMRFSDQGYSDYVRELLLTEDMQALDIVALELKCVIQWARDKIRLFQALVRQMCHDLRIPPVSEDDMSSDEECQIIVWPASDRRGCSDLDAAMNSQHCGVRKKERCAAVLVAPTVDCLES